MLVRPRTSRSDVPPGASLPLGSAHLSSHAMLVSPRISRSDCPRARPPHPLGEALSPPSLSLSLSLVGGGFDLLAGVSLASVDSVMALHDGMGAA